MFSQDEIDVAVKVIKTVADDPTVGVIAELISAIQVSGVTKEVRVTEAKETR